MSTTLYADDPDVHRVYPITARSGSLDFSPVVEVRDTDITVTAVWLGEPGLTRDLKVPLAGLPAGSMLFLRLRVPNDNDLELDYVVLE